jgi:hypothetical protein
LDYTGRLLRQGKATMSQDVTEIVQRIGSSADSWRAHLEQFKPDPGILQPNSWRTGQNQPRPRSASTNHFREPPFTVVTGEPSRH